MFRFNNRHIFTGYLKQLLASVNLPQYRIYTIENELYTLKNDGHESPEIIRTIKYDDTNATTATTNYVQYAQYIKNGYIEKYVETKNGNGYWEQCVLTDTKMTHETTIGDKTILHNHTYFDNKYEPNTTKKFIIKNNIYDTYTHEYLGDYLRFQRDYHGIDLMPLYNCFSNNTNINVDIDLTNTKFNSNDKNYKIYAVPVKFFKNYTIAIDSELPVEMCCTIEEQYPSDAEYITSLAELTYKKFNSLKFDNPELFDKLLANNIITANTNSVEEDNTNAVSDKIRNSWFQNEKKLKLLIKLPITNTSSITILEGNYTTYNNRFYCLKNNNWYKLTNKTVTNYEYYDDEKEEYEFATTSFKPITPLQLLMINTGVSYPFSNELLEYLSNNVITQLDEYELPENIQRVKKLLILNKWKLDNNGVWDPKIRPIIYDYLTSETEQKNFGPEILGYIDKNAETNVKHIYEDKTSIAISGMTLEEEDM